MATRLARSRGGGGRRRRRLLRLLRRASYRLHVGLASMVRVSARLLLAELHRRLRVPAAVQVTIVEVAPRAVQRSEGIQRGIHVSVSREVAFAVDVLRRVRFREKPPRHEVPQLRLARILATNGDVGRVRHTAGRSPRDLGSGVVPAAVLLVRLLALFAVGSRPFLPLLLILNLLLLVRARVNLDFHVTLLLANLRVSLGRRERRAVLMRGAYPSLVRRLRALVNSRDRDAAPVDSFVLFSAQFRVCVSSLLERPHPRA